MEQVAHLQLFSFGISSEQHPNFSGITLSDTDLMLLYAFSTALENPQSVDSLTENDFHQRNSRDKQIILRNHSMFY